MTALDDLDARLEASAEQLPEDTFTPVYPDLPGWIEAVFAPTFARRTTAAFRWCGQWWQHPEAIVRLEALWRTWESLHLDPVMGMATWLRDHLDPQLAKLTAHDGPFAECAPGSHHPQPRLSTTPPPSTWWPTTEEFS
ncbi:DUF4913 domain-containing protein [Enterococcus hirae]|uniref:DUF4913 domain-containing protein n=1 Tax=Enterococcus hirae TaxID=1354 RepID=UPI00136EAF9E|nr:DUF4913 domain-containing protein [Enterococcus hirae]NAE18020.1 DUF4913 domain-containing protein [Enterococcus hirae]